MRTLINIIISIPVISTFIIALAFFGIGVYEAYTGIVALLQGKLHTEFRPGLVLFEALDMFLIGFLFFVFSIGFAQLFVSDNSKIQKFMNSWTPNWLKVENFTQLKLILWDTVLTTLVVLFAGETFRSLDETYDWKLLFIPIAVLLIAFSKFLIKRAKKV
jgi:uncharacterized membrane protein YqhA